jgi:hypothetical protein
MPAVALFVFGAMIVANDLMMLVVTDGVFVVVKIGLMDWPLAVIAINHKAQARRFISCPVIATSPHW